MAAHAGAGGLRRPFLLVAWVDTEDFDAAVGPVGCGCELREDAATAADESTRAALEAVAPAACERWQCPAADARAWYLAQLGVPPPETADHLDEGCREVLAAVERLTGAKGLTTCPMFYTRLPWVHAAARARRWAERGELRAAVGHPTAVLISAVDLVDRGIGRQQQREADRRKAEAAKQKNDLDAAHRGRR